MDKIQKRLLEEVADLHEIPAGAYNIRANGQMTARNTTANINIVSKEGRVLSIPKLDARHVDAMLIHEAAIGKIAGEQLIKLMTLGLTEKEAEECIVNGFLK